jgi:hypothetical protein
MNKFIVTTTINPPSRALVEFAEMPDWTLIVVGDRKTPHEAFHRLPGITYLTPEYQEREYPELSSAIGWDCIQRRNIGFVEAYRRGADVVATVDDDNIPYDFWGKDLLIGKYVEMDAYSHPFNLFEPLSVTNRPQLWHRGYPPELLSVRREQQYLGKVKARVLVQADLWDGDPDVDALCRITHENPLVRLEVPGPYTTTSLTLFNSQNTFIHRSLLPDYMVLAHSDRMDDVWGGILLQLRHKDKLPFIAFNRSSVYQHRNYHDPTSDLRREMDGHQDTLAVITNGEASLSQKTRKFIRSYHACYER